MANPDQVWAEARNDAVWFFRTELAPAGETLGWIHDRLFRLVRPDVELIDGAPRMMLPPVEPARRNGKKRIC